MSIFVLRQEVRGFTLMELIMVLVLLGVLAVFAIGRMPSVSTINAKGFHDETLTILRFAQKTAIAQRRAVCVTFNSTGVTLTMFAMNPITPSGLTCATATAAQAPALSPPFVPSGGTGLSVSPTPSPTPMQFTPLGSTDQTTAITVSITDSTPITIEASTGYVHE